MTTPEEINTRELMEYYGYKGRLGEIRLKLKLLRAYVLQFIASMVPTPGLAVLFHRAKGCKIGHHVYIGPGVHIDILYPGLVTIEDYVSIGMNSMIFAHSNPTNSIWIKQNRYPRKVAPVTIKRGSWVPPGVTILCGVTIGENSVIGAHSLVTKSTEPYTINAGIPAKEIAKIQKE
jgi:acetyltransferase-like isoleucine patch superfamily enzyme